MLSICTAYRPSDDVPNSSFTHRKFRRYRTQRSIRIRCHRDTYRVITLPSQPPYVRACCFQAFFQQANTIFRVLKFCRLLGYLIVWHASMLHVAGMDAAQRPCSSWRYDARNSGWRWVNGSMVQCWHAY